MSKNKPLGSQSLSGVDAGTTHDRYPLARVDIMTRLQRFLKQSHITEATACDILGMTPQEIKAIQASRVSEFSLVRLIEGWKNLQAHNKGAEQETSNSSALA